MNGNDFRDRFLIATRQIPCDGDIPFTQAMEDSPIALCKLCGGKEAPEWIIDIQPRLEATLV